MFKLATFRSEAACWPLPDAGRPFRAGRSSLLRTLLAASGRLWAAVLAEVKARRAMRTLAELDERMLRDIGIERGQIEEACRRGRETLLRPDPTRWA